MAIKLVKEFNLLTHEPVFVDSSYNEQPERIELDSTVFNGTVSYYFEVVAKNTHTSALNLVLLKTTSGYSDVVVSITASTTSWTRFRSSSFTPDDTNKTKRLGTYNTSNDSILSCRAARILIFQNAGSALTATESQIEIGSYQTVLALSAAPLTYPKYWTYTSANWDGTVSFAVEAVYMCSSTKGALTVYLQEDDGSWANWTNKTTVVNASTATVVTRTRVAFGFTPTDGRHYRLAVLTSSSKYAPDIYCAKVIVQQGLIDENTVGITSVLMSTYSKLGQSFTCDSACTLGGAWFKAWKTGSPPGYLTAKLYEHSGTYGSTSVPGTLRATSEAVVCTSLPTSADWVQFVFTTPYSLSASTYYVITIETSETHESGNNVSCSYDATDGSVHDGNRCHYTSSWTANASYDLQFRVFSAITKTESTFLLANTGVNTTGLQNFDQYYDSAYWEDVTVAFYHEIGAIDTGGSTCAVTAKLQSDPNGTPADITNSSVTVSTTGRSARGASAMTMVDDKEIDVNPTSIGTNDYLTYSRIVALVQASVALTNEVMMVISNR